MGFEGKLLLSEKMLDVILQQKNREKGTKHRIPALSADGQQRPR